MTACIPASPTDDEERPFLYQDYEDAAGLEEGPSGSHHPKGSKAVTPLPKAQLASLCMVRLVDPIAFTQIFPYVNEMMEYLKVTEDHSKIGFYSGLVESSFAVSQLLSIYHWAKLSDKIGRRPVILIGITGIALTSFFLGLSNSLIGVLIARALGGFFSGNIAVIHSVLGEITDSTNQAIAFPIYGLCWPFGAIVGPLIGGTLSNPVERFPEWFGHSELLKTHPYFLPSLFAAAVAALGSIGGFFCLQETLPSKLPKNIDTDQQPSCHPITPEKPHKTASIKYLLSIPTIRALCLSGCFLSFINTAFDVVFVLFCYSSVQAGGLAFTASQIGYALATSGAVSAGLQLFCMPYLLSRFDHAKMYNFCMGIWPYCFVLLPGLNLIAQSGLMMDADGAIVNVHARTFVWIGIGIVLALARSACLAYSVSMILVRDSAPDPSSLGATNGLAQFAQCFARAFSPAFASSLFAFSVGSNHIMLRYVWVVILTGISMFGTSFSRKIEQGMKASRVESRDS